MRWVTTVTVIWVACWLFVWGMSAGLRDPSVCQGEAALGCGLIALLMLPLLGLCVVATPVILAFWVVRLGRWVTRKPTTSPGVGYISSLPPPEKPAQYTITGRRLR